MNLGLKGKVMVVTGGAKGIGWACCLAFAAEGANVFCIDIDRAALGEIGIKTDSLGLPGSIFGYGTDLSICSFCESGVMNAVTVFGGIDILVNNVGIEPKESFLPIHDSTLEMWNHILGVNLTSHFLMMKYALPAMVKRGGGVVINVASVQAFQSEKNGVPAYGVSKSGILGLTRIAALHYAEHNIRVLAVCPGAIDTPLVRAELDDEGVTKLGKLHPIGRIGTPEEVARVITFLASGAASFMTGTAVYVDGGLTAKGAWDRS